MNTVSSIKYLLYRHGEVEDLVVLEVLERVFLDDGHSHVGVAERFDAVPDAHDELVLLAHSLHILCGIHTLVSPLRKPYDRGVVRKQILI